MVGIDVGVVMMVVVVVEVEVVVIKSEGARWLCWRSVMVELNGSLSGHTWSSIIITFLVLDYENAVSRSLLGRYDLHLKKALTQQRGTET